MGKPSARHPETPEAREARIRGRNRAALLWITLVCLILAAAGYAFGRWMMAHPPKV